MTDEKTTEKRGDGAELKITAEAAPATITHDGESYTFPSSPDDWPFAAVEAMEQGKALTFVRLILGPEQMRRFLKGGAATARDGAVVMDQIIEAAGSHNRGE